MARTEHVLLVDAGVVVTDPMWALFDAVGSEVGRSTNAVAAIFHYEFSADLWSGRLAEAEFWPLLAQRCGAISASPRWRTLVMEAMRPQPWVPHLVSFADESEVWLVGNYRHEWLDPALRDYGMDEHLSRRFISSRTAWTLPHPALFERIRRFAAGREALFVGASAAQASSAAHAGLHATVADSAGAWLASVEQWLMATPPVPVSADLI